MSEATEQRAKRERQRVLFDSVAELYHQTRQAYAEEVVCWVIETAGLGPGAAVLEVGCGTGLLTAELARFPLAITAIDIGPAMIEVARRNLPNEVRLVTSPFEEFKAADASFDLVISATADHWIDPDVFGARSARLLRSGGWLAIMSVFEDYDEPFRSALIAAWVRRSSDNGARARTPPPSAAERIASCGLFEVAVEKAHARRVDLSPERVMNVERTRATYLDYDPKTRESFGAELRRALSGMSAVSATIRTQGTMARVCSREAF
ncbi:MAG: methyltransferase domain-containing protein [Acidimicrobiaceae bacterium]|nr:methyltransferase domain-containing protein [Acidimicrobiaceae bacterium]